MIRALYSAASGMTAQQLNIDNIANNLANANTVGYKSRRAQFQDLMYQTLVQPGSQSGATTLVPTGLQLGLGTRTSSNEIIFSQGAFTSTGQSARHGDPGQRIFPDQAADGRDRLYPRRLVPARRHRRHRHLQRQSAAAPDHDPARRAVDQHRDRRNRQLHAARTDRRSGRPDRSRWRTFRIPAGLNSIGQSLYLPTDASGAAVVGPPGGTDGAGTMLQGYVEQSNVSVVDEFINLISSQRAYEANSKVVKAADDMYSQVNNLTQVEPP